MRVNIRLLGAVIGPSFISSGEAKLFLMVNNSDAIAWGSLEGF
jgi:hypothetical protein